MHSKSDSLGYLKDQKCKIFLRVPPPTNPPALKCLFHSLIRIYFFPDSRFVCGGMSVICSLDLMCTSQETFNPARVYLLKVNNRNTRTSCEICSKLLLILNIFHTLF